MVMPSQLVTGDAPDYTLRNATVPDFWDSSDVFSYTETFTGQFNETGGSTVDTNFYNLPIDIGGREWDIRYAKANFTGTYNHTINFRHTYTQWEFFTFTEAMNIYNSNGLSLVNQVLGSWHNYYLASYDDWCPAGRSLNSSYNLQPFRIECNHFKASGMFWYDAGVYDNVTHAWDFQELHFWVGLEWDELQTGLNAWDIVGMLLFYEMPDVHWTVNAIFKIVLWTMIGYLVFAFVLAMLKGFPFT